MERKAVGQLLYYHQSKSGNRKACASKRKVQVLNRWFERAVYGQTGVSALSLFYNNLPPLRCFCNSFSLLREGGRILLWSLLSLAIEYNGEKSTVNFYCPSFIISNNIDVDPELNF